MIVVIGSPRLRGSGPEAEAAGLAASIAAGAATEGSRVELVGRLGDDPAGDDVLIALARAGVGHVAMLRDPARPTTVVASPADPVDLDAPDTPDAETTTEVEPPALDAADVDLALRYLPEIAVIVAVHLDGEILAEAADATDWAQTSLIVVVPADNSAPDGLPSGAVSLAVADEDESAAGALIGRYAAALDRGEPGDKAYAALMTAVSS